MSFLSLCLWNMCEKIKLLMEKCTDYISIVCGMPFWQLCCFGFFYKKRKLLLEYVFVVLNLFLCPCLTFSKYLFAFSAGPSPSVCCESWRRLSALSWGRHSLQARSEVTWVGRGIDCSWGSLPAVSSLRHGCWSMVGCSWGEMLADARKPPGQAVGPPGWV